MSKSKFEDLQKVVGLNHIPDGLLSSQLNVVDTVTYDWVHTFLQDGVFSTETSALVEELRYATIVFYTCNLWCGP